MVFLNLPQPYLASLRTRSLHREAVLANELDTAQAQLDASMRGEWMACVIGLINLPRRRQETEQQLQRVEQLERDLAEVRGLLQVIDEEIGALRAVG